MLAALSTSVNRTCCSARPHTRTYARSCFKIKPRKPRDLTKLSPLKKQIASEVQDILSYETVAVVHYGDLNSQAWTSVRLKLADSEFRARVIPTKVATRALDDTRVQNITELFKGSTALVYGDFEKTDNLLACINSEPKLCLLGGKVLDQLLTPNGLAEVAKLPSLEVLQQELIGLLCLPQRQTLMCLQSAPSSLSSSLTIHVSSSSSSSAHSSREEV